MSSSYFFNTEAEESMGSSINEIMNRPTSSTSRLSDNIISKLVNQHTLAYHKKHDVKEEGEQEFANCSDTEQKDGTVGVINALKEYLARRKIGDLLHYMMQHLVVNEPDDPVAFLRQLIDKCLMFRSGILCEPPLVFEDRHITSLYHSFDVLHTGFVNIKQYHVGMQTLGLKKNKYEMNPELEEDWSVSKQTFTTNAKMALVETFMDMVLLPPPDSDGKTSSIESIAMK